MRLISAAFWAVLIFFALIIYANVHDDLQYDQKHAQEQKAFEACAAKHKSDGSIQSDLDIVSECP